MRWRNAKRMRDVGVCGNFAVGPRCPKVVWRVSEVTTRPSTTKRFSHCYVSFLCLTWNNRGGAHAPLFNHYNVRGGCTFSKTRSRRVASPKATLMPCSQICSSASPPTVILQSILPQQSLQFPRDFIDLPPPFERRIHGPRRTAVIHSGRAAIVNTATRCWRLLLP